MLEPKKVINSREIISRLKELKSKTDFTDDELDELDWLDKAHKKGMSLGPILWTLGAGLVREDGLREYAKTYAKLYCGVSNLEAWPHNCIDWQEAEMLLRSEMAGVEYKGCYYYINLTK